MVFGRESIPRRVIGAMARHIVYWSLALVLLGGIRPREVRAQAATINSDLGFAPGGPGSLLGSAPGSGGGSFLNLPGTGGLLSGRIGISATRAPASITNPTAGGPTALQVGIGAPAPQPLEVAPAPIYGSLALPTEHEDEDEGPPNGLTLDVAIDRMLKENLDLRAKFFEIPQARADILQANLRSNPVFYADTQLQPYGQFNRSNDGGPAQYDVNISYPLDISRKRQARTRVAERAQKVLEAQYQDAVRGRIDDLYTAWVDVLAARQTVRYSNASVQGLERLRKTTLELFAKGQNTRADVNRVTIQLKAARVGFLDAQESYRKTKRALAALLILPPSAAESLEVRGTLFDLAPPPPPIEELERLALENRPDIISFRLGVVRAEADVRLAKANVFQDVYLLYQPYTLQNNTPYGLKSPISWAVGVTVPLPVYNRNQGAILRSKLNVTQTQIELATLERQTMTDVEQAEKEYRVTHEMVKEIRDEILPAAIQVRDDTYRLYLGGQENLFTFLHAQQEFNDTVKQYLDSMTRHRRSMLDLNTAVGQRILP
jgi:cobalt-zinc-cadmium efflux system outer membrane protein